MVHPRITKKTEKTFTPVAQAKRLFQTIYRFQNKKETSEEEVSKIKVSELISKMSFYYEKIRNTVDYEEEHLLRKNAIERILKRQIVIEGAISIRGINPLDVSKHLLTELIRAAYLSNNSVPETKIDEVALIIKRYLLLREYSLRDNKQLGFNEKSELSNWIMELIASEIEELLGENDVDAMIIEYMYEILREDIAVPENSQFANDDEIQIYLGIHRNFLKFDKAMLSFILFKYYNANWQNSEQAEIEKISRKIMAIREAIEKQLDHPLTNQLNRIISRYTVFFSILRDVVEEDPKGVYESFKLDPKAFPRMVKNACAKRYAMARSKLWRAAFRSILYIFITKSIFAIALEVPATKIFGEELNGFALMVNIIFPALLLFIAVLFTRLPSDANTDQIVSGIHEIIFEEYKRKDPFKLRQPAKRSKALGVVFALIYTITFFMSFGIVVWTLNRIGFNFVSIVIFLFFLTFVSFFTIRIRKTARELLIIPPRESLFSFFADFFYIPIVVAGKWLSEKFSQINVFIFVLDVIIEAPFKVFVEIAEEWTKYVKERKDEIA
jgi:hypothetical protein